MALVNLLSLCQDEKVRETLDFVFPVRHGMSDLG
jgi:hypothetical protein